MPRFFGWSKLINPRMFTLSQGQFWIEFPEGFGFPVMSNEEYSFSSQVLNHNIKDADIKVRHKIYIDYIRDQELKKPLKPLFNTAAFVMALVEGDEGTYNVQNPNEIQKKASCSVGLHAPQAFDSSLLTDQFGKKFSSHWVVKPGREVRNTLVTQYMNIPFDTTIHFIALHLHPFAESLELKDLTTGETVYKSYAKAPKDSIGLADVDYYLSEEGVKVYRGHEYGLISIYNNDTGVDQDAMATMFIYLHDKEFQKPQIN